MLLCDMHTTRDTTTFKDPKYIGIYTGSGLASAQAHSWTQLPFCLWEYWTRQTILELCPIPIQSFTTPDGFKIKSSFVPY